jgi:hypothetical protein
VKYVKILGLLVAAVTALLAFAGAASATTLTSPTGTVYTGSISAESEGTTTLHNSSLGVSVSCSYSTVSGLVQWHGKGSVSGSISNLTFGGCGEDSVKVLGNGFLEVWDVGSYDGTVFSTWADITITDGSTGVSCTYSTGGTDIGTLQGGASARLTFSGSSIPRKGDSIFCGSTSRWTKSYKVTSPASLYVDS